MKTCSAIVSFLLVIGGGATLCQTHSESVSAAQLANSRENAPAAASSQSTIDPAKKADIGKLMQIVGTRQLMMEFMGRMEENARPLVANALPPGDYRDKLLDLFFARLRSKIDLDQLLDLILPVYDKYFSAEEIKALIAFYQTPIGQKTASVLPKLTTESSEIGRKWGEKLGQQAMQEILAEHPEFLQAMQEASKAQQ
jgi:uncharacterized protein